MLSTGDNPQSGTLPVTGTAQPLGNRSICAVLVQCDPGAGNLTIKVGDSGNQTIGLAAGQTITIPCSNLSQVYVVSGNASLGNATCNFLSVQ